MKDTVIPYTLPEVNDHSFFFISQHISPEAEAKLHRHKAWELYFVTQGHGIRMTGDTLLPFSEGDLVLIPPSMPHYWEYSSDSTDENGEVKYLMVAFSQELIDKCMDIFPELRNRLFGQIFPTGALKYGTESSVTIKKSLMKMCDLDDIGQLSEMFRLLPGIFTNKDHTLIGRPIKIERDIRRMQQVATYVMTHYAHTISLNDIARHIGMNRSAFCRFFKRNKGMTFSQFVISYRLKTACELLKTSKRQVSEICFAVGFNDLPHFIRVFTANYGLSPSKFRKQEESVYL